jgi:hypothetical protein
MPKRCQWIFNFLNKKKTICKNEIHYSLIFFNSTIKIIKIAYVLILGMMCPLQAEISGHNEENVEQGNFSAAA